MVRVIFDFGKRDFVWVVPVLLVLVVGFVYAINSGDYQVMGHTADEINGTQKEISGNCTGRVMIGVDVNGLVICEDDDSGSGGSAPLKFEVYHSDTTTYACVQKDLEEWCGDADGCTIRLIMQHETDGNDQVRIIDEHIYMEQSSLSKNRNSGTYGWTRQGGGGDHSWIMGTSSRYSMFSPWGWVWAHNYIHDWCSGQSGNGPAFSNDYMFNFMSHPNVRTNVIVYDSVAN